MPAVSLVVCVHNERDLLQRLLRHASGCYDDLTVVHDGPDTSRTREVVEAAGGRFFERPREHQQEPHWPFAWGQAKHSWILRLDADEFPSDEMKNWLVEFRRAADPGETVSGYTCIWPLWNGRRVVSKYWPAGRHFLFHKQRVRFFGMVEAVPVADFAFVALPLVLRHEPTRRSYGIRNLLFRRQAYTWRNVIALSLLRPIVSLQTWRWETDAWPPTWEQIRRNPFRTALSRLAFGTARALRDQWLAEKRVFPMAALSGPLHHALIGLEFWRLRRGQRRHATAEPNCGS